LVKEYAPGTLERCTLKTYHRILEWKIQSIRYQNHQIDHAFTNVSSIMKRSNSQQHGMQDQELHKRHLLTTTIDLHRNLPGKLQIENKKK
jgi:hypothetical protein